MQTKRKNKNKPLPQMVSLVSYCPLCNTSFSPDRAVVIGEGGNTQLLHVNCNHCTSSIILLLLVGEVGVSSVGLVTDLIEEEVLCFKNSAAVSSNDLIDLHQLLYADNQFII